MILLCEVGVAGHVPDREWMALRFSVVAECPVTKARVASMCLPHHTVDTPVFMPVGTQGSLKGLTSQQLAVGLPTECQIMLGNTYHLANRPVRAVGTSSSCYL